MINFVGRYNGFNIIDCNIIKNMYVVTVNFYDGTGEHIYTLIKGISHLNYHFIHNGDKIYL